MRPELPVVWKLHDTTCAGGLRIDDDRVTLTSKGQTLCFSGGSISSFAVERAPAERLRGLPVLCLRLDGGIAVRVASLGGAGSLHELAALIGGRQPVPTGT